MLEYTMDFTRLKKVRLIKVTHIPCWWDKLILILFYVSAKRKMTHKHIWQNRHNKTEALTFSNNFPIIECFQNTIGY